jgi:hypothetical protein
MKKYKIVILLVFVLFVVAAGIYGYFLFNKPHRDILKAKVDYTITSSELLSEFEANSTIATQKYDGKILLVSGKIESINSSDSIASLQLSGNGSFLGVNCSFNSEGARSLKEIKLGDEIQVKGECKGYIEDVILNNCFLIN